MSNTMSLEKGKLNRMMAIKWLIAVLVPLTIYLFPTSETFTPQIKLFFVITMICIFIMAFELTEIVIPAMLLPILYIVSGLAAPGVVFAPWLGIVPWMNLGGLLLAAILVETGLLKRIAYWCIIKTGCSYNGIMYALMVAGFIINLVIPGQALMPLAAITYSICQAFNLGKSRESAGIMLAGFFAATIPSYFYYSSNYVMFAGPAAAITDIGIAWIDHLLQNMMMLPWGFILIFMLTRLLKPKQKIEGKEYFEKEYKSLGKANLTEKKAIGVCLVLFAALLTNRYHGIQPAWIYFCLVAVCFLPFVSIATKESLKKVNFPFIFLIAGCMAIGEVANVLGIGTMVSDFITPILTNSSTTLILLLIWILGFVFNFLLTPVAIASTFTLPLTQIALDLSIDPHLIFYTMVQGCENIILPYEWPFAFIVFSFGLIPLKDFIKVFTVKSILAFIYFAVVIITYWKLIGLM